MLHHLREHELAQVHPYLPRAVRPQDGPVPRRRRGSNRQLDEGSLSKRFSTTYHDRSAQRWDTIERALDCELHSELRPLPHQFTSVGLVTFNFAKSAKHLYENLPFLRSTSSERQELFEPDTTPFKTTGLHP